VTAVAEAPGGLPAPDGTTKTVRGRASGLRAPSNALGTVPRRIRAAWQRVAASGVLRTVLGALRAVLTTVTPSGRGVVLVALVGWSAANRFGWAEGALAAATALAALAIAVGFVVGRTRVSVTTAFPADRVVAGQTFYGTALGRNTSGRRTVPTRCELPVGGARQPVDLPSLAAGAEHTQDCTIRTSRRGVIDVGPAVVVRADPLGLLRRESPLGDTRRLWVHPLTTPLEPSGAGIVRDLEGMSSEQLSSSDLAFHALREYAPGDDLRHVHWRSSARLASLGGATNLLVRQYVDTRRSRLAVAVSASTAEYASEDAFELGISCAASLARRAMTDGQNVDVAVGGTLLDCTAPMTMLDGMAEAGPGGPRAGLEAAVRQAVAVAPDASIAVLVVGHELPTQALRLLARRFPPDAKVVVLRPVPGSAPGRAVIGPIDLLTVGALSDLRGALRLAGKG